MKAAPAIGFRWRSSRVLFAAMLAVTMLALIAVWISAAPHWLHLLLSLFVLGCAGVAASSLLHPRVASLVWHEEGGVDLSVGDKVGDGRHDVQGAVSAARMIGPLIVLTLRWPPRERTHLWILPDNLDADTRRRLRMRLGAAALTSGNTDNR